MVSLLCGCDDPLPKPVPPKQKPLFVEVTTDLGLPSPTPSWPDGKHFTPEIGPGGVALLDYDNDGDLDIYQICHAPPQATFEKMLGTPAPNRLFQQQDDGRFVEVENAAGLNDPGFGHGVAVGDVNNDGWVDVYVTNHGQNRLMLNDGNGAFTDVTETAGLVVDATSGWSTSTSFLDYDGDGHLDLYVVNFGVFDPDRVCNHTDGARDYCGPHHFVGLVDALFHNKGDGTFEQITADAGITSPGRGWGVVCVDLTGDDRIDIYVANDLERNFLWVNQGDGTFRDEAIQRGVAFNGRGIPEASMGVAVGDMDNDGAIDLFMTHFMGETNTLYRNQGTHQYRDRSASSQLGMVDQPYTGWGCGFVDFDNDGDLDLIAVNGRVSRGKPFDGCRLGAFWSRYAEPNLLFENQGAGKFIDVGKLAGALTGHIENTRGLAWGDIDSDGDIDVVTSNIDNTLRLFRNEAADETHWLLVRAIVGQRDAIGAKVTLESDPRQTRTLTPGQSFLSSCDSKIHFGLDKQSDIKAISVVWPNGRKERFPFPDGVADQTVTIRQGDGQSPE